MAGCAASRWYDLHSYREFGCDGRRPVTHHVGAAMRSQSNLSRLHNTKWDLFFAAVQILNFDHLSREIWLLLANMPLEVSESKRHSLRELSSSIAFAHPCAAAPKKIDSPSKRVKESSRKGLLISSKELECCRVSLSCVSGVQFLG